MSDPLFRRLALLEHAAPHDLLRHCRHGIEKESLRVDRAGQLALTPHPQALGSALTNAHITTDYSEALLEFITDALEDPAHTLDELDAIHRYTYARLGEEQLWTHSMPCPLPDEATIPIAEYGTSHVGRLKHVYRKGLALRYGKAMQCIAGIHYNFSLPEALWPLLQQDQGDSRPAQDWQSASYFALIRNFRRHSWLLMYLFGASPAVSASFLKGREHDLDTLGDDTLYLPWATSLRMSDLGYQNNAQASLTPCYDRLDSYLDSLRQAVSTPYPPYQAIGTRRDGEWLQLNTNVLQIENEYYSTIRPKRVANSGERPIQALGARGVQYVEVRCLDIDPFLPLGIDLSAARFLDAFLLYCALEDSPILAAAECRECTTNFALTVKEGRRPGLQLGHLGQPVELKAWGLQLLERIEACARLLDAAHGDDLHHEALASQRAKLEDARLTPSARVLQSLSEHDLSFFAFAQRQVEQHTEWFRGRPLDAGQDASFEQAARASLAAQEQLEREQRGSFEEYVACYMAATGTASEN
ncbi:MAG: glutamate--cysteine ligase [Azoarcus sp.]|nr:glutamate--cysteine ligase [Azoarcus sp.]